MSNRNLIQWNLKENFHLLLQLILKFYLQIFRRFVSVIFEMIAGKKCTKLEGFGKKKMRFCWGKRRCGVEEGLK
jgi:hypothetical protein